MDVHALVINLQRSADRLQFQHKQLARIGVSFERLHAVDADAISDQHYNERAYGWQRPMSRNEVGCFLSHRLAWQRVVAMQRPTLILEDDVIVSENIVTVLAKLQPPREPVIYNLETSFAKKLVAVRPASYLPCGHAIRRIFADRGGSAAYVITPQAAQVYLSRSERCTALADAFMNHLADVRRLQIDPALVVQMAVLRESLQDGAPAALTTMGPAPRNPRRSLFVAIRRPRMKLRRLRTNLSKFAVRGWTIGRAKKRRIAICPTIVSRTNSTHPSSVRRDRAA